MLRSASVSLGEPGVLARPGRVGMGIAMIDRFLVTRDLGVVVEDARLVCKYRGLRPLQDGQCLHVLTAPAKMVLRLCQVVGMRALGRVGHRSELRRSAICQPLECYVMS